MNSRLVEKGWSQADLSKRAQVSPAMVSSVLSGKREPGISFCNSIASVLRVPPEDVYRMAGLLPSEPEPEDKTLYKIQTLYHTLREDGNKARALQFLEFLTDLEDKDGSGKKPKQGK